MQMGRTTLQEIQSCKFRPEHNTIHLNSKGEWFCVRDEGKIVACLCIRHMKNYLCFDELYTLPEYRHHGVMSALVNFIANTVYKGRTMKAICLKASRDILLNCGFKISKVEDTKTFGTTWWVVRDGDSGDSKAVDL